MSDRVMELISRIDLDWTRRVAVLIHGDRPSATSMLNTLERGGWVVRRRDAANRRHVIVEPTDAGRDKLASVPERLWRSGRTELDPEAGLDAGERCELLRLLEMVHAVVASGPLED